MLKQWFERLENGRDEIIAWRRHLHRHPELSFHEEKTAAFIAEHLRSFGIEPELGVGGGGVIGIIRGGSPGKTLALRADFDALPIQDEKEGVPYCSTVDGVMHACGHDGHTATLLGVAKVLAEVSQQLRGNVLLLFQHAEELMPGGAQAILASGAIDRADVIFGAHLTTQLPLGTVGLRAGGHMAAADMFEIRVQGKGGHGARPHQTVDALVAGSQIVALLQQVVSRRIDPLQPAVLSIGEFHAGTAFNVIADSAVIKGTVRTFDPEVREQVKEEIEAIVKGVCLSAHADYELAYTKGYPPLINHQEEVAALHQAVGEYVPELRVEETKPKMSAEDFAYYLQAKPGAFYNIGARTADPATHYTNHHPKFDFDERALLLSGKVFLSLVGHYLL